MSDKFDKFDIFNPPIYNNDIDREEERTYYPAVKAFNYNDETDISMQQQDGFLCTAEAYLCIEGELKPNAAGDGVCRLSNNAAMHLFDSLTYWFDGEEIEKVRNPGLTTTVRALVTYTKGECAELMLAGWNPYPNTPTIQTTDNDGKKFWFRVPFSFIFGVAHNYPRVMIGRHRLQIVRSRTDDNSYITTPTVAGGGADKKATIDIHEIFIRFKNNFPSRAKRLKLMKNIDSDRSISVAFRKWEYHELTNLRVGNTIDVYTLKTTTQLESPQYIILFFQTDALNNTNKDITKFDHINLRNYRVWIGSKCYPYNNSVLNFNDNQYLAAYQAYIDLVKVLGTAVHPAIDYITFKSRPLFIIDCSKQEEGLKATTVDVKTEFESTTGFPANTRGYCMIIHDKLFSYKPLSEQVLEIK